MARPELVPGEAVALLEQTTNFHHHDRNARPSHAVFIRKDGTKTIPLPSRVCSFST